MRTAILTGSHVYGTPGPKSDVDLVVLLAPAEAADLARIMGGSLERHGDAQYPVASFRAGMLNVIVETEPDRFEVWVRGTEQLVKQAPVDRETAVELFSRLREERALDAGEGLG